MKNLRIGNLVAQLPIIQGGMGVNISLSGLAAAVANEGGIGVIATAGIGMLEKDLFSDFLEANNRALRNEIRKARALTKGLLGVNIMVALSNYGELVRTAIEEKIDFIFSGAGLPLNAPEYLKGTRDTKLVPIISSGRAAALVIKRWLSKFDYAPDAIVVEGPLAGGHLGFRPEHIDDPAYALERLIPEVLAAIRPFEEQIGRPIPVIAAGGIYTGCDIDKFLKLGAAGVQMATRFVGTVECDASPQFKQAYLDAKPEDIVIIKSPVGLPGRAIRNAFIEASNAGQKMPFECPYHCIITCEVETSPYCIALALANAYTGSNGWRVKEIVTVKALVDSLKEEYDRAVAGDPAACGGAEA
jgi:nitronate monooxygenase